MEAFFENDTAISAYIKMYNGFIAGSACLAQLTNASWKPNDIDIWIPIPNMTIDMVKDIKDMNYDKIKFNNRDIIKSSTKSFFEYLNYKYIHQSDDAFPDYMKNRSMEYVLHIMQFTKDDITVQVILTADVPMKTILSSFDISVCKIAWIPSHIGFYVDPTADADIESNRALFVNNHYDDARKQERIDKYKSRGFDIYVKA